MGSVQKRKDVEGVELLKPFDLDSQVQPPEHTEKLHVKNARQKNRSHSMTPFISSKCKVTYSDRKHISGCLGRLGGGRREEWQREWGNLGSDQYLDYDDGFRSIYIWIKIYQITHFMYVRFIYYMSIIPQSHFLEKSKKKSYVSTVCLPNHPSHTPLISSDRNKCFPRRHLISLRIGYSLCKLIGMN